MDRRVDPLTDRPSPKSFRPTRWKMHIMSRWFCDVTTGAVLSTPFSFRPTFIYLMFADISPPFHSPGASLVSISSSSHSKANSSRRKGMSIGKGALLKSFPSLSGVRCKIEWLVKWLSMSNFAFWRIVLCGKKSRFSGLDIGSRQGYGTRGQIGLDEVESMIRPCFKGCQSFITWAATCGDLVGSREETDMTGLLVEWNCWSAWLKVQRTR